MASIDEVIAAALRQVGKPYVFGEDGPTSFDCSGLISYAFGLVGISLPHNAAAQQKRVTRIASQDAARPGDLVFYGYPAHHVALYLGDGRQIAAPHSGTNVQVQKVSSGATFGRVGGLGIGSTLPGGIIGTVAGYTGNALQNTGYGVDDYLGQARGVSLQIGGVLAGLAIVGLGLYILVGRRTVGALQAAQSKVQTTAAKFI